MIFKKNRSAATYSRVFSFIKDEKQLSFVSSGLANLPNSGKMTVSARFLFALYPRKQQDNFSGPSLKHM